LRYFRFVGRTGSRKFDKQALSAIRRLNTGLARISGERIWMEMSKILTGDMVHEVLKHMSDTGVLAAIGIATPELAVAVVANVMGGKPETVLCGLISHRGDTYAIADAWKLSRDERKVIEFLVTPKAAYSLSLMDWKKLVVEHSKELVMEGLCLVPKVGWSTAIEQWDVPTFPLRGADILASGVEAGPEVGRRLNACKLKWMDSEFTLTKDDLCKMAETV